MREIDRIFTLLGIVLSNEYSNEIVSSGLVELNALVTGKVELQQENVEKLKMSMIKAIIRPLIVLNHHLVDILIS